MPDMDMPMDCAVTNLSVPAFVGNANPRVEYRCYLDYIEVVFLWRKELAAIGYFNAN